MRLETLPHVYPFRFVDRTVQRTGPGAGRVAALLTAGGRSVSSGPLGAGHVAELMAQAALLLARGGPEPVREGVLAGLSGLAIDRPPEPGDALTVHVAVAGRLGSVVKLEATVVDADGGRIASGSFTIRQEALPGEGLA